MPEGPVLPPFRRAFDAAMSPYAARNALGITDTGGGGGGISDAPSDGNTYGRKNLAWVDLGLSYQPLDGDLTALAALGGTNTIYYRSAADTWSAVTIGTGLSFSGGTLSNTVSTAGLAPLASPAFTGDPTAPTPATGDNDTSIATTAFVKAQNYITSAALSPYAPLASPTFTGDPKAPTPTAGDNDTSIATTAFVANAISAAAGGGFTNVVLQKFTASGTYTPTASMKFCIVECIGGGGGGGSATGAASCIFGGGGGGAGGYSRVRLTAAAVGASQTVTIGSAGTAGTSAGNGGNGGDTSFGTLCIGKGGSGGAGTNAGATFPSGGVGGVAGTGDIVATGGAGFAGAYSSGSLAVHQSGGNGGSSAYGGGALGPGSATSTTIAGAAASNYGAGGAGGMTSNTVSPSPAGGAGAAGICIITEFI